MTWGKKSYSHFQSKWNVWHQRKHAHTAPTQLCVCKISGHTHTSVLGRVEEEGGGIYPIQQLLSVSADIKVTTNTALLEREAKYSTIQDSTKRLSASCRNVDAGIQGTLRVEPLSQNTEYSSSNLVRIQCLNIHYLSITDKTIMYWFRNCLWIDVFVETHSLSHTHTF